MQKNKLIKGAKEVFKANPDADQLIATADEQYFLPEAKGLALDYARKNGVNWTVIEKSETTKTETKAEAKTKTNTATKK